MTIELTMTLSLVLLSLSLLVQSFEMLSLCSKVITNSPWSWHHVRNDFIHWPPFLLFSFDHLYVNHFKLLILIQIALSFCLPLLPPMIIPFLIITYLLVALRFRGNFNGGSDAMTMVTLISLLLLFIFPSQKLTNAIGFYLLAFHCTLSYFISGVVKFKNSSWRSGVALEVFLTQSNYAVPASIQRLAQQKMFVTTGSWLIILFESCFPLVWVFPNLTGLYITAAFLFHIINYFCLGLNRFVFAWLVTYPALFFCTQRL